MSTLKRNSTSKRRSKDQSEIFFESYLKSCGIEFEYEPNAPDKSKHPDYPIEWNGTRIICEVKGLYKEEPLRGAAHIDPCSNIRRKISKAQKQFKEYKVDPCVLVLHIVSDWTVRNHPFFVFGAMLGNPGFEWSPSLNGGKTRLDTRNVFMDRGKMINSNSRGPQNTTISAIAMMSEFRIPNLEFELEYKRRVKELQLLPINDDAIGARLDVRMELYKKMRPTRGSCIRLDVYENPFARKPLALNVLDGPYDTRYRWNEESGKIQRTQIGHALAAIEKQKWSDLLQQIDQFNEDVVAFFKPKRIVMFGSQVWGSPDSDSDVDLLVEFPGNNDASGRSMEIRNRINRDFPMDLICWSTGQLEKRLREGASFLSEILERGTVLYETSDS